MKKLLVQMLKYTQGIQLHHSKLFLKNDFQYLLIHLHMKMLKKYTRTMIVLGLKSNHYNKGVVKLCTNYEIVVGCSRFKCYVYNYIYCQKA